MKDKKRTISVVIPTYNRQAFLQKCLSSFVQQTYPPELYEVIIVDDGSGDGTFDCIKSFQKKAPFSKINYVYQQNKGPAAARNLGVNKAEGDIIAFIDDDCIVSKNWLESIADTFAEKPDIAVCGTFPYSTKDMHVKNLKPHPERYFTFEYMPASIISTNNCALYKSVFHKIGGFDESFVLTGGEDPDFIYRLLKNGYKVYHTAKLIVFHHPKTSFRPLARQSYVFGLNDCIVLKRYFPKWFVINLFFMRVLNGKEFYYFKNSPIAGYFRFDILKIFIALIATAYFNRFLSFFLLALLFVSIIVLKGFRNAIETIRYFLISDFFYLCGHIKGSFKNKILYF